MAVGKVAAPQVRSNTPAPAPAKPKTADTAQQATKAGWGGGAQRAASLKITLATIDEGPTTSATIKAPKGYKADLTTDTQRLKDTVHGKEVTWESDVSNLKLTGPNGKKTDVLKESGDYSADWKSEVASAKKDAPNEYMQLDWSYGRNISSVGTVGKMMGLQVNSNDYMGGAHPNHGTGTVTIDASTGQPVKLDSLISQQQMNSLVNDIAARLDKMKGPDDIGGESFSLGGDKASIREAINNNFALVQGKDGKVKIDISWDSGVHALGGLMAHFQVEAPTDQQFKSRVGIE
ncbi:MAG: hypothetical protein QM817_39185 [Archangium sp.]